MSDLDLSQFMPQENRGMNANLFKYGPKHDANFTNIGVNDQMHTIASVLDDIYSILSQTYGPSGNNILIHRSSLNHSFTKDGYTVINSMAYNEPFANTILEMVKRASMQQARSVGDGSTTVILIACKLYQELSSIIKHEGFPKFAVVKTFETIHKYLVNLIDNIKNTAYYSKMVIDENKLTPNDYYRIAMVSTNGDTEICELIKQAYEKYGNKITFSFNTLHETKSRMKIKNSFTHYRGMINPFMKNVESEVVCKATYDNPRILMINGAIEKNEEVNAVLNIVNLHFASAASVDELVPLVIVANKFSQQVNLLFQDIILNNRKKSIQLPLIAIDHANYNKHAVEKFMDLAVFLGASLVNLEAGENLPVYQTIEEYEHYFGSCEQINVSDSTSEFVGGLGDEDQIQDRIAVINKGIAELGMIEDQLERGNRIQELQDRIDTLDSRLVHIYVGGLTPTEIKTRSFLVEDAIKACKSASEHGVVRGNNLFIPTILLGEDTNIIEEILKQDITILDTNVGAAVQSAIYHSFKQCFTQLFSYMDEIQAFDTILTDLGEAQASLSINTKTSGLIFDILVSEHQDKVIDGKSLSATNDITLVCNPLQTEVQIIESAFTLVSHLLSVRGFVCGN